MNLIMAILRYYFRTVWYTVESAHVKFVRLEFLDRPNGYAFPALGGLNVDLCQVSEV